MWYHQDANSFHRIATQVCQAIGHEDIDALPKNRHTENALANVDIEDWAQSEMQRLNLPRDLASQASTIQGPTQGRSILCHLADLYEVEKRFYTRRAQFELEKAQEIFQHDQAVVNENVGNWDDEGAAASSLDASSVLDILAQGLRDRKGE